MDTKTIEPASDKIRLDYAKYWEKNISPLVGWDGHAGAPDVELAMLHARIWRLYRIAVTHEGTVN